MQKMFRPKRFILTTLFMTAVGFLIFRLRGRHKAADRNL